jgi:tRNA threonylcarbamoyladenosine biosynthesis protein TsaE
VTRQLAVYDPAWTERFEDEAGSLRQVLGDFVIAIEHVGSTAVPGLAAKPTVDIAVGARSLELPPEAIAGLEELGYEAVSDDSRPWERRFRKGRSFPRDVLVHVVEWGGRPWVDYLRFRDALRADPERAREYERTKRDLLDRRDDWYSGRDKEPFVARVLAGAPARAFARSGSVEETEKLAARLAARLRVGDVVSVSGELGSGKTTFVRGAARGLGVTEPVTSPTFTIGHRYAGDVDVSHLDLYRFSGVSAAEWGDLEPYFDEAIVFVEWPEAGVDAFPPARLHVRLEHGGGDERRVDLLADETALLEGIA